MAAGAARPVEGGDIEVARQQLRRLLCDAESTVVEELCFAVDRGLQYNRVGGFDPRRSASMSDWRVESYGYLSHDAGVWAAQAGVAVAVVYRETVRVFLRAGTLVGKGEKSG